MRRDKKAKEKKEKEKKREREEREKKRGGERGHTGVQEDPNKPKVEDMTRLREELLTILNQLGTQKLDILVNKIRRLTFFNPSVSIFVNPVQLQECVEVIFEKVLGEADASEVCARLCQVLQWMKVPVENSKAESIYFKKLLISRCQKEFDKNYMESLDRDKYSADMAAAPTVEERSNIKAAFEVTFMRKSLGNIIFIGELYKLQMLTARIMHEVIKKLLQTRDELSLQCLCRLLISVGQILDQETTQRLSKGPQNGLNDLSVYFSKMVEITQDIKVSSRVRSHLQFVIELRLAGWKLGREIAGQNTLAQIQADIFRDAKLNLVSLTPLEYTFEYQDGSEISPTTMQHELRPGAVGGYPAKEASAKWKKTMETMEEEDLGWLEVSKQLSDFELDEDDGDFLLSSVAGEVLTVDDTEEQSNT